jgi:hypothetical protein
MTASTRHTHPKRIIDNAQSRYLPAPEWFVTGPASPEDLSSSTPQFVGLRTHAKTMGTNITACGLSTTSWTKLWSLPFDFSPPGTRCRQCISRVYGA